MQKATTEDPYVQETLFNDWLHFLSSSPIKTALPPNLKLDLVAIKSHWLFRIAMEMDSPIKMKSRLVPIPTIPIPITTDFPMGLNRLFIIPILSTLTPTVEEALMVWK